MENLALAHEARRGCRQPESCQNTGMVIRPAEAGDGDAIWEIMKPILRAGETYTLPRDIDKQAALAYWLSAEHEVFVAQENGAIVGTYFLKANQQGGGGHVAN